MKRPMTPRLLRVALIPLLIGAPALAQEPVQDPITTGAAEILDASGLIARQSELGEGILLLDRQLRLAEAVEKLINLLGPDAMIETAPGQFVRFADTPAGIRAQIEMVRLRQELDALNAPPPTAPVAQPSRTDGSELLDLIDQRISERTGPADEGAAPEEGAERLITVREIYGTGAELTAVLQYGPDRVRVRVGDTLVGGVRIIAIEQGAVRVSRSGQELLLVLPN